MKKWIPVLLLLSSSIVLFADQNRTKKESVAEKHLRKQMEKEKRYARERAFYQGKEYNLKDEEIDEKSLSKIPVIEPDYDFDMDDVYSD